MRNQWANIVNRDRTYIILIDDDSFSFMAFGCHGTNNILNPEYPLRMQQSVANAMKKQHKEDPVDFCLQLGDNIYPGGVENEFSPLFKKVFYDVYDGIDVPFFTVLGNHDYGHYNTNHASAEKNNTDAQVAHTNIDIDKYLGRDNPKKPIWFMPQKYYKTLIQSKKNNKLICEFYFLDTQAINQAQGEEQMTWLKYAYNKNAPLKILVCHHPFESHSKHEKDLDVIYIRSVLKDKNFDYIISAHEHNNQFIKMFKGGHQIVAGCAGKKPEKVVPKMNSLHASSIPGFCHFAIKQNRVEVSFISKTNQSLYLSISPHEKFIRPKNISPAQINDIFFNKISTQVTNFSLSKKKELTLNKEFLAFYSIYSYFKDQKDIFTDYQFQALYQLENNKMNLESAIKIQKINNAYADLSALTANKISNLRDKIKINFIDNNEKLPIEALSLVILILFFIMAAENVLPILKKNAAKEDFNGFEKSIKELLGALEKFAYIFSDINEDIRAFYFTKVIVTKKLQKKYNLFHSDDNASHIQAANMQGPAVIFQVFYHFTNFENYLQKNQIELDLDELFGAKAVSLS